MKILEKINEKIAALVNEVARDRLWQENIRLAQENTRLAGEVKALRDELGRSPVVPGPSEP